MTVHATANTDVSEPNGSLSNFQSILNTARKSPSFKDTTQYIEGASLPVTLENVVSLMEKLRLLKTNNQRQSVALELLQSFIEDHWDDVYTRVNIPTLFNGIEPVAADVILMPLMVWISLIEQISGTIDERNEDNAYAPLKRFIANLPGFISSKHVLDAASEQWSFNLCDMDSLRFSLMCDYVNISDNVSIQSIHRKYDWFFRSALSISPDFLYELLPESGRNQLITFVIIARSCGFELRKRLQRTSPEEIRSSVCTSMLFSQLSSIKDLDLSGPFDPIENSLLDKHASMICAMLRDAVVEKESGFFVRWLRNFNPVKRYT